MLVNKIKEILKKEEMILDNTNTEQAPSGEWAEYNINYLIQEARVDMLYEVLEELKTDENS